MKRGILLFVALICLGCSAGVEKVQSYIDDPQLFVRDPHFKEYKQKLDDLEVSYLHKEITYAEYVEEKEHLDQKYTKEVSERTDKVISPDSM